MPDDGVDGLVSAEDFFRHFGVAFDPAFVAAHRLAILKRFRDLIRVQGGADLADLPPERGGRLLELACREVAASHRSGARGAVAYVPLAELGR